MSLIDKAIAAVTPPVSDEKRAEARAKARAAAEPGDWLSQILDHHELIETAFAAVKSATGVDARRAAQKKLGVLLTGHSIAEEAVIYPALAHAGKKMHANIAYTQQVAAKMQMAALEHLDPLSEDYLDKLGHLGRRRRHPRLRGGKRLVHRSETERTCSRPTGGHAALQGGIPSLHRGRRRQPAHGQSELPRR